MALDGVFLNLIKDELQKSLVDARVDKIHQPSKEEIIINFRTRQKQHKILFNVNASQARVHKTCLAVDNPKAHLEKQTLFVSSKSHTAKYL